MTLDTHTANSASEAQAGSIFSDTFPNWVMAVVGMQVPYGKPGVLGDVQNWMNWMLFGGTRPRANKRVTNADGVDALAQLQDYICGATNQRLDQVNFHDPGHYALIERITRPLPHLQLAAA